VGCNVWAVNDGPGRMVLIKVIDHAGPYLMVPSHMVLIKVIDHAGPYLMVPSHFFFIYSFQITGVLDIIRHCCPVDGPSDKLRNIPYVIHKIIRQVPIIHGTHQLVN
jgi:hypothetical protein